MIVAHNLHLLYKNRRYHVELATLAHALSTILHRANIKKTFSEPFSQQFSEIYLYQIKHRQIGYYNKTQSCAYFKNNMLDKRKITILQLFHVFVKKYTINFSRFPINFAYNKILTSFIVW